MFLFGLMGGVPAFFHLGLMGEVVEGFRLGLMGGVLAGLLANPVHIGKPGAAQGI